MEMNMEMNFVSCVKFVKQGVAKAEPDQVHLEEKEIQELLNEDDECEEHASSDPEDKYNFSNYEAEDDTLKVTWKGLASFEKGKKRKKFIADDSDSEKDDDLIKPDDNLILVGEADEDQSLLVVYVFNDKDGDMYVHHDIMLQDTPLCIEPLYYWKYSERTTNLCVVGGMNPVIELWDLDIIGCVEPLWKLGRYKEKSPEKNYGHTDAVLDIAWNPDMPHILASASVDQTVLLWDLDNGELSTTISHFGGKVHSVKWNPTNSSHLLTGCSDKFVRIFDCRIYDKYETWELDRSVEKVIWGKDYMCYAATENGSVYVIDTRNKKPVYNFEAHDKEISGLAYSNLEKELLLTCSADAMFKIWDIRSEPRVICSKNCKLDALTCLDVNPDLPNVVCVGGSSMHKNMFIKVIDIDKELHSTPKIEPSSSEPLPSTSKDTFGVALLETNSVQKQKSKVRRNKFGSNLKRNKFKKQKKKNSRRKAAF